MKLGALSAERTKPILQRGLRAVRTSVKDILGSGPTVGIVFHHIPKCAGNSVSSALRGAYPPWTYRNIESAATAFAVGFLDHAGQRAPIAFDHEDWARIRDFRQRLLLTHLQENRMAVSGHVVYHPLIHDRFAKTHKFVTVLREPVKRFASQYLQHLREKQQYHSDVSWDEHGISKIGPEWGRVLTNFLGGAPDKPGELLGDRQMIRNAKANLKRLDVVGFVEDLPAFGEQLGRAIGSQLKFEKLNPSTATDKVRVPLDELRSTVEAYCAPDIEVYEYARKLRAH
jgi:hypothetical protein